MQQCPSGRGDPVFFAGKSKHPVLCHGGLESDAIIERAVKILKRTLEKEPVNKERERLDAEEKKNK